MRRRDVGQQTDQAEIQGARELTPIGREVIRVGLSTDSACSKSRSGPLFQAIGRVRGAKIPGRFQNVVFRSAIDRTARGVRVLEAPRLGAPREVNSKGRAVLLRRLYVDSPFVGVYDPVRDVEP